MDDLVYEWARRQAEAYRHLKAYNAVPNDDSDYYDQPGHHISYFAKSSNCDCGYLRQECTLPDKQYVVWMKIENPNAVVDDVVYKQWLRNGRYVYMKYHGLTDLTYKELVILHNLGIDSLKRE